MFRLFSTKKMESVWAFEAIDSNGASLGVFPSVPMAERKVKESGGGTIRPRKSTADELTGMRKKAVKTGKGIRICPKKEKPAEGLHPCKGPETFLKRMSGQEIRDLAEIHCAIGGNIPVFQNPMIVLDESHIVAYKCDSPLGLEVFARLQDSDVMKGSKQGTRKVIESSKLKQAVKNLDPKKMYDISVRGKNLCISDGKYGCFIEMTEDDLTYDPFRLDLDVHCWAASSNFCKIVKDIAKSCEYTRIQMEKDGFIYIFGEGEDGKQVNRTAIGLADGFSVHTCSVVISSKMLVKVSTMFRKIPEVRIEIEEDYPVKFVFDYSGRRYQAMIAPRIGA